MWPSITIPGIGSSVLHCICRFLSRPADAHTASCTSGSRSDSSFFSSRSTKIGHSRMKSVRDWFMERQTYSTVPNARLTSIDSSWFNLRARAQSIILPIGVSFPASVVTVVLFSSVAMGSPVDDTRRIIPGAMEQVSLYATISLLTTSDEQVTHTFTATMSG